jgi:hypothetical protein
LSQSQRLPQNIDLAHAFVGKTSPADRLIACDGGRIPHLAPSDLELRPDPHLP